MSQEQAGTGEEHEGECGISHISASTKAQRDFVQVQILIPPVSTLTSSLVVNKPLV